MYNPPILNKASFTNEEYKQHLKELSIYNQKWALEVIRESPTPINWETLEEVLMMIGNNDIWKVYCAIVESPYKLTLEAYNKGLALSYTMGRADYYRAAILFQNSNFPIFANENDKIFYNSLPDTITIYRGTSEEEYENEEYGLSWSTDRGVAEFFAFRFTKERRVVLELQISKEYVFAAFTDRNESEIIFDYESVLFNYDMLFLSPTITTDVPTSFYNDFVASK